jgi:hypothetical protein
VSTTFTGRPRALANAATWALTCASSVAAMTSVMPSRSTSANGRSRSSTTLAMARSSSVKCGATTTPRAPARSSSASLRAATGPPPTTRQGRPRTSRKIGK